MGARAYKKDSHVRKLVEQGGFEKKAAETNVEVDYEVVEEVTENLASEEFVESEFKAQREYMDTRFEAQKEYMDVKLEAQREYMDVKLEAMKREMLMEMKYMRLQFIYIALAAIALMQGLHWLHEMFG